MLALHVCDLLQSLETLQTSYNFKFAQQKYLNNSNKFWINAQFEIFVLLKCLLIASRCALSTLKAMLLHHLTFREDALKKRGNQNKPHAWEEA